MSFRSIFERVVRIARSQIDEPYGSRSFDEQLRRAEELIEESRRRDGKAARIEPEPRKQATGSKSTEGQEGSGAKPGMDRATACRILGISIDSTTEQAAAAYRQRIRRLHPDKNLQLSVEEQERAHRSTQELNSAYEFLKRHPRR